MPFLTNTQLRHGAWGSEHADSAHSSRGIFSGAREGRVAWQESLRPELGKVETFPVIDTNGNLYFVSADGGLQARTSEGAPILVPHPTTGIKEALSLHLGPGPTVVAVCKNALICLGLDGTPRWRIEGFLGGAATVAPDGHALYVAQAGPGDTGDTGDGLIALGFGTGIELWRKPFPGRISGPAIAADGTLFLIGHYDASPPYRLLAIDGKSGETLWQQKIAPMLMLSTPRLFGDELVVVTSSDALQAFHRDGRPAWTHALHEPGHPAISAAGQVAVVRGKLMGGQKSTLWLGWPDGQFDRETPPPRGLHFTSNPVFDAAGNLFLTAQDATPQKVVLKYNPDLSLAWAGAPHELSVTGSSHLAILPEALLLSIPTSVPGIEPASGTPGNIPTLAFRCIR